jgi:hypothetical protein
MAIRIDDNTQPAPTFLSPSDMPSSGVGYSAIGPKFGPSIPPGGIKPRPQFGPPIPPGGIQTPQLDFSAFDGADPRQDPTGPSGPAPTSGGNAGNPFLSFLASLFSRGVGGGATPQGMTGLLTPRGQGAPGTNTLGNPFNRFG